MTRRPLVRRKPGKQQHRRIRKGGAWTAKDSASSSGWVRAAETTQGGPSQTGCQPRRLRPLPCHWVRGTLLSWPPRRRETRLPSLRGTPCSPAAPPLSRSPSELCAAPTVVAANKWRPLSAHQRTMHPQNLVHA